MSIFIGKETSSLILARTSTNVIGNSIATAAVTKRKGELGTRVEQLEMTAVED